MPALIQPICVMVDLADAFYPLKSNTPLSANVMKVFPLTSFFECILFLHDKMVKFQILQRYLAQFSFQLRIFKYLGATKNFSHNTDPNDFSFIIILKFLNKAETSL